MAPPLAIAHVSPHAWEDGHEVNVHVRAVSDGLAARGHRVLVVAPSHSPALVRESRKAIRAAREDPDSLLPPPGETRVLGVGEVLALARPTHSRRRAPSVPIDVARTLEAALTTAALDVVHVHEPWAPSTASAALRHSHALNVATFHAATERFLAGPRAGRVTGLLHGRIDTRLAAWQATADLLRRYLPGEYRVVTPGAAPIAAPAGAGPTFCFVDEEERAALRVFLRALRLLPLDLEWTARVASARDAAPAGALRQAVRERIEWTDAPPEAAVAGAQVVVLCSAGLSPAPGGILRARAAGASPLTSRLPIYEEAATGLFFEPGDVEVLAAQMERLVREPGLGGHVLPRGWDEVAAELEDVYVGLVARRHDGRNRPDVRARLRGRPLIDVDLHMHTDHSHDCATPVEVLLREAKARGLGAIAVTDHNEVSGALEAARKADGIKVIVGEEVKTDGQGEVIGLFLTEKIPRGMSLEGTIAEIRRQGGVVYVPHPFDRLHSVPDYEHLCAVLADVDAIEVFNPRVAIGEFNEEAVRFAAKYRIPGGAGSDAHVPQGLGSVRIRMRDFDGPEEFLESLREADVIRTPANLLYVQALKFLQTTALPRPAREAVRDARVRRAARKS